MSSISKRVRQYVAQGWQVEQRRGCLRLTRADAARPVFVALTPSDWRATKNTEATMRRVLREARSAYPTP